MWYLQKVITFLNKEKGMFTPGRVAAIVAGTAISSFGIYNIHQQTQVTEGGVLGLILLIHHWTGISPAIISPLLDILCYAFAFRYLGGSFLSISAVSTLSLAMFFKIWEQFPPLLPDLSAYPFAAALAGGLFVGVGVGLIVRQGASSGGDDALAMTISKVTRCRISQAYLATDLTVLLLSLSYIPLRRIAFSLITVTVSSLLIEFIQNYGLKRHVASVKKQGTAAKSDLNVPQQKTPRYKDTQRFPEGE